MIYVEAPSNFPNVSRTSLFVAGTISGAQDWQTKFVENFLDLDVIVYNPRRKVFSIDAPDIAFEQINWEFKALESASIISFWFSHETLSPIVLFELGRWSKSTKPIVIGIDPKYVRKQDVEIQIKLARPDIKICYSLDDLAKIVSSYLLFFIELSLIRKKTI